MININWSSIKIHILVLGAILTSLLDWITVGMSINRILTINIVLIILLLFISRRRICANKYSILTVLWIFYNLIIFIFTYNTYFMTVLIQQIIYISVIWFASDTFMEINDIQNMKKIITIYSCLIAIYMLINDELLFSSLLFSYTYFLVPFYEKRKLWIISMLIVVFFVLEERSRVLAVLVIGIMYYLLPVLSKKIYSAIYWVIITIIILIPPIYLILYNLPNRSTINQSILYYTGKNFFSGRQYLWIVVEEKLNDHQLFGYGGEMIGGSNSINDILGMSTHNLFLFLRLQGGVVLLGLFVVILYFIWMDFYKNLQNPYVLSGACYLIGLLFRTSFDLVLLANDFVNSFYLWIPIIIAISLCNPISRFAAKSHM